MRIFMPREGSSFHLRRKQKSLDHIRAFVYVKSNGPLWKGHHSYNTYVSLKKIWENSRGDDAVCDCVSRRRVGPAAHGSQHPAPHNYEQREKNRNRSPRRANGGRLHFSGLKFDGHSIRFTSHSLANPDLCAI